MFYLKGVAPKSVTTMDIYRGVVPFILIQILVLISLMVFPSFYGM
ncbi:dicarboxylate transporter [Vibrio cholerae]|nr:dicarboxylate transporter [Vibrio cholerae]